MFEGRAINVIISFASQGAYTEKMIEMAAGKLVVPGEIHLAHADKMGVRYLCVSQRRAERFAKEIGKDCGFAKIITRTTDKQENIILMGVPS